MFSRVSEGNPLRSCYHRMLLRLRSFQSRTFLFPVTIHDVPPVVCLPFRLYFVQLKCDTICYSPQIDDDDAVYSPQWLPSTPL